MLMQLRQDARVTVAGAPGGRFFWIVTGLVIVAGAIKRLAFPGAIDFPLGEGGLFVLFSDAILAAGFALPSTVSFGGRILPFAYPPASFYLAAAAGELSGADLFTIYHVLPRALNLLAIPAFCWLAARITRDRIVFAAAVLLYALMPESITWQITGGGMPRSLAALLALLALAVAVPISERSIRAGPVLLTGLLVGLAILSHLEWGMFAAIGVTLLLATRLPVRLSAKLLPAIGLVSLLVILPWLLTVLARHGLEPFLSSASASAWSSGETIKRVLAFDIFAGTLTIPAAIGAIRLIRDRDPFLALWTPLILLTTPRMGHSAGLAIPTAILAAYGIREVADFVVGWLADERSARWRARVPNLTRSICGMPVIAVALTLFFASTLVTQVQWLFTSRDQVEQVDRPSRAAMAWIRANTPPESRFILITPAEAWFFDRIAEWFPYLARRRSLTTAQGLEWAGPGIFTERLGEIALLKALQIVEPRALPDYLLRNHCQADHVALFFPRTAPQRRAFAGSADFLPVRVTPTFAIYRTRSQPCAPALAASK